jgi:hypothetical protein
VTVTSKRPAIRQPWARRRGALRPAALLALGASAALGVVAVVDPNQPGHYPTCPFLALTGYYCPGCGMLRAVHDLAHGDLSGAMARNPLAVVVIPLVLAAYALWVRRLWRGVPSRWTAPAWVPYAAVGVFILFGVLRNLPGWTWLSPA